MQQEKFKISPADASVQPIPTQSVEPVDPSELDVVARVLAESFFDNPFHLWAMPKAATRLEDATVFFKLALRWMQRYSWDVLATADRSAVSVARLVRQGESGYPDGARYFPKLVGKISPVNAYFEWIETFRPKVEHVCLEYIGCLPEKRSKGLGSIVLRSMLAKADRQGLGVWAISTNQRNLTFYSRGGFEIGTALRQDESTPPVTPIWHPPASLAD
jgi:GNAT superfamily N-acetyltransferase